VASKAKSHPRAGQRTANVGLTEQEIVDCTLRLIRTDGMKSLSMRKLASELGVAPMSLYHYVKNKDELLEHVVDTLLARVPTPPPRKHGWREQLRTYAMTVIEQLAWHPGIARLVIEQPPTIEGQRHLRYTGAVLIAAGFDTKAAAQCMATFHTFLYGVLAAQAHLPALMAVVSKKYDVPNESDRNASTASPRALGVNEQLRNLGLSAWYQAGIDSILSAIALQLRQRPSPSKRSSRARASHHARGDA
jgi:AcrR family transcriptional regulator